MLMLLSARNTGNGSVLAAASEDGSFYLLDVSQALDRRPSYRARQRVLRQLLSSPSSGLTCCSLAPPRALGSSLLIRRSWALLLRLVIQVGCNISFPCICGKHADAAELCGSHNTVSIMLLCCLLFTGHQALLNVLSSQSQALFMVLCSGVTCSRSLHMDQAVAWFSVAACRWVYLRKGSCS